MESSMQADLWLTWSYNQGLFFICFTQTLIKSHWEYDTGTESLTVWEATAEISHYAQSALFPYNTETHWDTQGYVLLSSFLLRYLQLSLPTHIGRLTATCLWSSRKPLGLCCQGWRMHQHLQSIVLSGPQRGGISCWNVMMYFGVK